MSTADIHATRRKAALDRVARTGGREGAEAKRILAEESAIYARKLQADKLATLPKSIAEAKGDARAFAKADIKRQVAAERGEAVPGSSGAIGRTSMLAEMKKLGIGAAR